MRLLSGLTALVLVLTGCSGGGDEDTDGATAAAERLAAALVARDLADAPLDLDAGTATERLEAIIGGMGDLEPAVEVGDVAPTGDGDAATATLRWSWPVHPEQPWTYDSEVDLQREGDAWAATWAPTVVAPGLEPGDTLDLTPLTARRADITGARGRALVTERPVFHVGIDRTGMGPERAGAAARALAAEVGVDPAPYVKQVQASGERAFVPAITYRAGEVPDGLASVANRLDGAVLVPDEIPLAPTREFAAPLLGSVGPVTAEMVQEQPDVYAPGDVAGLSGLQARYDEQLRGTDGVVVEVHAEDGETTGVFRVDAAPGTELALTLDQRLQTEAERLLADIGPASALVAVRPGTGEVLAAANGPGNDGQNLATFGQYAPGSTFKVVTALALLRSGLAPGDRVRCPPTTVVDGKQFGNYSDYPAGSLGPITLREAIAQSCNTALIEERERLGGLDLFEAASSLGMGIDHDLGFPAYFGQVEPAEGETELAANLIGQGRILASPMVMATVIASVQQGSLVVPHLVAGTEPEAPDVAPLADAEVSALRELLRAVVTSGSGRGLADVPGPPVIAKTGTAEFQGEDGIDTHAWMVAAQGDLAVAVFVGRGESGSGTAGPVLEAFLRAAQNQ